MYSGEEELFGGGWGGSMRPSSTKSRPKGPLPTRACERRPRGPPSGKLALPQPDNPFTCIFCTLVHHVSHVFAIFSVTLYCADCMTTLDKTKGLQPLRAVVIEALSTGLLLNQQFSLCAFFPWQKENDAPTHSFQYFLAGCPCTHIQSQSYIGVFFYPNSASG